MATERGPFFPEVLDPRRAFPPSPGRVPPPAVDTGFESEPPHHLSDYLRILYRHRRLAAAGFAATLALAVFVTLVTPRRYTASTRLEVSRQEPIQLRLQDNVRRTADADPAMAPIFLATQIANLQSRDLAERVIRRHHLAENAGFARLENHPAPDLAAGEFVAAAGELQDDLRPRGLSTGQPSTTDAARGGHQPLDPKLIDRYMRFLSVREVRGTNLVEVGFTTPSPGLSAFLVAAHTQAYMESNQDAQRATDAVAKDFLSRQILGSRRQIERAQTAIDRFATEHPQVAVNQEQKIIATRVGELSSLLTKAEADRTTLESRYEFLSDPNSDPLDYFLDRPAIQRLRLTLADVRARRAGLDQRLGPNHPQMLEIRQLENEINQQIRGEVGQEVASLRAHYDAARAREERLHRKLAQQEEAGIELRGLGARYDLLQNDVTSAQNLHASLLKQRMETSVDADLVASTVRVVERAEVPQRPSRPRVALNLTLGLLAGLLVGAGAAFGRDYFDASVRSTDEVEDLLQLPTLATIPNFARAREAEARLPNANGNGKAPVLLEVGDLIVMREPRSMAAEAFRSMRTAVLFANHDGPPKVVLVTSSRPGEGKTVGSLNLASTLAEAGSRVVLVDADLRHPRCHTLLGVENDVGLARVVSGEVELDAAIRPLDVPRLFFLPAGPPPPNPAEIAGSAEMRQMLSALRDRFDFVILDTPPVLPVTDAVILAREADGIVLVVKGFDTPRELVRRARDRLTLAGANFLGVMVNNVDPGWGDPYFYAAYGTYGRSPIRAGLET